MSEENLCATILRVNERVQRSRLVAERAHSVVRQATATAHWQSRLVELRARIEDALAVAESTTLMPPIPDREPMDAKSLLAKLARDRDALRASLSDLDRAMTQCQEAKRETLETLAELDAVLGAYGEAPG